MKKITLSALALGVLCSLNVQAADDLSSMFSEGKASGQIREFSISRAMDYSDASKDDYTRSANVIGGHLKFESADYNGLSVGTAFYTTNGFANDSDKTDYTKVDPTLLGSNNDDYSLLGEAYLQYKSGNTVFKAGRQKLATPMASADDARMLPNLFEAYLIINSDIKNTTIIAGHVSKFAQGTFGRAYNGGVLSATSGYSAVDSRDQVGEFVNLGRYAVGQNTNGVSVVSASYKSAGLKAQVWNYLAYDIANIIYADMSISYDFNGMKPFVDAQLISQSAIGDKLAGELAGLYYGVKLGATIDSFTAYAAFSQTSENGVGETYENAIVTPWGGMPAYTQGMVTRHMFLAGTTATKLAAVYKFKELGLKAVAYYANFAMADNNGYTNDDASEIGFDFIYNMKEVKGLELRLRGNFANDFNVNATGDSVGWDEYRFIANYNF